MSLITRGLGFQTIITGGLGNSALFITGTILNIALNAITLGNYSLNLSSNCNKTFELTTEKTKNLSISSLCNKVYNIINQTTKTISRR